MEAITEVLRQIMALKEVLYHGPDLVGSILFQQGGVPKAEEMFHQVRITDHLHPGIQVLQDQDRVVPIRAAPHIRQDLLRVPLDRLHIHRVHLPAAPLVPLRAGDRDPLDICTSKSSF